MAWLMIKKPGNRNFHPKPFQSFSLSASFALEASRDLLPATSHRPHGEKTMLLFPCIRGLQFGADGRSNLELPRFWTVKNYA